MEGKTPYEAMYGIKLRVGDLRVFGCSAYAHVPKDERQKLDAKAHKCIFLGYSTNRKGYRLYDQKICRVMHSRDVRFSETIHSNGKEPSTSAPNRSPQVVIDSSSGESDCLTDNLSEDLRSR